MNMRWAILILLLPGCSGSTLEERAKTPPLPAGSYTELWAAAALITPATSALAPIDDGSEDPHAREDCPQRDPGWITQDGRRVSRCPLCRPEYTNIVDRSCPAPPIGAGPKWSANDDSNDAADLEKIHMTMLRLVTEVEELEKLVLQQTETIEALMKELEEFEDSPAVELEEPRHRPESQSGTPDQFKVFRDAGINVGDEYKAHDGKIYRLERGPDGSPVAEQVNPTAAVYHCTPRSTVAATYFCTPPRTYFSQPSQDAVEWRSASQALRTPRDRGSPFVGVHDQYGNTRNIGAWRRHLIYDHRVPATLVNQWGWRELYLAHANAHHFNHWA